MANNERTIPEQILILETLINERSLIIDNIKAKISDSAGIPNLDVYNSALYGEILNHKLALQEYKEGLEKLKQL